MLYTSKMRLAVIGALVVALIAGAYAFTRSYWMSTIEQPTSYAAPVIEPIIGTAVETSAGKSVAENDITKKRPEADPSPIMPQKMPAAVLVATDSDEPPLKIKSIGIQLAPYDTSAGRMGDLVFTKDRLQFDVLFTEFGFVIPANQTSSGADKANPQPTFLVPMGTKVRSLVDGVVVTVEKLYSGDYSIQVASDPMSKWRYETEHVSNPFVSVGDHVRAGDVIAEVSPHNQLASSGYGMVEIGLLRGGNPPQHVCPFAYLDPSVESEIFARLRELFSAWETYRANPSLYDESAQPVPGCRTLDAIDG